MDAQRTIPFSPPDITDMEIQEVVDALKSGWITTGPRTKELERQVAQFAGTSRAACLNSATAALECALRLLGIGSGDEVITSAYTYTASASAICHVGATPILCDVAEGSYEMDYEQLPLLINERTKAIIPVDIAGRMIDYSRLQSVLEACADRYRPSNDVQERFSRLPVVTDAAHSFGAVQGEIRSGQAGDLTAFSFHAVKNFTTAEGGALTWHNTAFDDEETYKRIMLMSLHGQTKDALSKSKASSWEYDIAFPGWKCNMTDIQAALGLAQMKRYSLLLKRRHEIVRKYEEAFASLPVSMLAHTSKPHEKPSFRSSAHLMLVNITGKDRAYRDALIERMASKGVATNVHYKPLPLLTAYRALGFDIADFPHAYAQFENEITLPLHTCLTDEDISYIITVFKECLDDME